mgnify:CR=1 FL=1
MPVAPKTAAGIMTVFSAVALVGMIAEWISETSAEPEPVQEVVAQIVRCRTRVVPMPRRQPDRLVYVYIDSLPFEIRHRDPQAFVGPILSACVPGQTVRVLYSSSSHATGTAYWLRSLTLLPEGRTVMSAAAMTHWKQRNARWAPVVVLMFTGFTAYFGWAYLKAARQASLVQRR